MIDGDTDHIHARRGHGVTDHDGCGHHAATGSPETATDAAPASYLSKSKKAAPSKPRGTIYTCPMHPQIRRDGPGSCPICGMALEPLTVTAEAPPNHELTDMTRRFWIGLVLAAAGRRAGDGRAYPGARLTISSRPTSRPWCSSCRHPVVLWAGWPFFERAWASVVNRSLNMFSLIALGTGAAYLYSLVATFLRRRFPAGFRGMDGTVAVYFEAAAVITVLVLLGQVLELRAREQTGGAIRALLNLAPKTARRLRTPGATRRSGWPASSRATGCGCVPVTACRWTARCSMAAVRSMNPWSPARPCRSRKLPGDG